MNTFWGKADVPQAHHGYMPVMTTFYEIRQACVHVFFCSLNLMSGNPV